MGDFKPGDEVVCVDAGPDSSPVGNAAWKNPLVLGATYTVRDTGIDARAPIAVVLLAGHPNPCSVRGVDVGFMASRFRKVQRRDLTEWLATEATIEEPKRTPAKRRERA